MWSLMSDLDGLIPSGNVEKLGVPNSMSQELGPPRSSLFLS